MRQQRERAYKIYKKKQDEKNKKMKKKLNLPDKDNTNQQKGMFDSYKVQIETKPVVKSNEDDLQKIFEEQQQEQQERSQIDNQIALKSETHQNLLSETSQQNQQSQQSMPDSYSNIQYQLQQQQEEAQIRQQEGVQQSYALQDKRLDLFAFVETLPRDQFNGKMPRNVPMDEKFTVYGRFDKKMTMAPRQPDIRNNFDIKNKVFYKHDNNRKEEKERQGYRGHQNYVYNEQLIDNKIKDMQKSYKIGEGRAKRRKQQRPQTTDQTSRKAQKTIIQINKSRNYQDYSAKKAPWFDVPIKMQDYITIKPAKKRKKKSKKKAWQKVKRKRMQFNFDIKGTPLPARFTKPKKYVYKPKERENKKYLLTNDLYSIDAPYAEGPLFENQVPDPVDFDDFLIKDENFQSRKYKILKEKGKEYEDIMDLVDTIEHIRYLQAELKTLMPNTIDKQTRTIRAKKIHEYERIYNLVCMHHRILNQKRLKLNQKVKPDRYLGKDNHILREIMYKVNNYSDKMIPSMKPEVLRKVWKDTYGWTKEADLAMTHLDNLQASKMNKKVIVKQTEGKELQIAKHNSILAAHFQRLKKYYSDEEMKKIQGNFNLEGLDLGQDKEITYPGTKGLGSEFSKEHLQMTIRVNKDKHKQKPKLPQIEENETIYDKTKRLKIEKLYMPYGPKADKNINIKGSYLEDIPDINNILKNNIKKIPKKYLYRMEEMVEGEMRKEKMQFQSSGDNQLTKEERLIQLAANFEKNMDKRKKLQSQVNKHMKNIGIRIDQFLKQQSESHKLNFDKDYMFLDMVKKDADKNN